MSLPGNEIGCATLWYGSHGISHLCVLLVEDEALIREIMAESLQDAGYDVFEAANGLEATEALEKHAHRSFCIVVTDYHMPGGMNGSDVAMQARTALPDIPVIIASGRPDVLRASWKIEHGFRLLRKPYLPSQLVAIVRALVGPGRPPYQRRAPTERQGRS